MPVRPGFTLIELIVVLFILLLMTTAVVPRVVALPKSRRLKDVEARVIRLPAEARNEAVRTGKPVRLRVDGADMVMDRVPVNGTPEEVKRVALGTAIQVDTVEQDGRPAERRVLAVDGLPRRQRRGGRHRVRGGRGARSRCCCRPTAAAQWVLRRTCRTATPERWPAGQLHPAAAPLQAAEEGSKRSH